MAGRRSLTPLEERMPLAVVRDLSFITAQWFTGFRISKILSLKAGQDGYRSCRS